MNQPCRRRAIYAQQKEAAAVESPAASVIPVPEVQPPKKRGRPAGSKNKKG